MLTQIKIKKITVIVFFIWINLLHAQDDTRIEFQYGSNISSICGNEFADKTKVGYNFLVVATIQKKVYDKVHFLYQ